MPKKIKNKKGGFWGNTYFEKAKGWNPFSKKEESVYVPPVVEPRPIVTPAVEPSPSVTPVENVPAISNTIGGRRKSRRRPYSRKYKKQKGGFHPNETSSRLALNAIPFSGITAQPQVWLGGKTRKRRKNKKRYMSHKNCRH